MIGCNKNVNGQHKLACYFKFNQVIYNLRLTKDRNYNLFKFK